QWQEVDQQPEPVPEGSRLLVLDVDRIGVAAANLDAVVLKGLLDVRVLADPRAVLLVVALLLDGERLSVDFDRLHVVRPPGCDDVAEADVLRVVAAPEERDDDRDYRDENQQVDEAVSQPARIHWLNPNLSPQSDKRGAHVSITEQPAALAAEYAPLDDVRRQLRSHLS